MGGGTMTVMDSARQIWRRLALPGSSANLYQQVRFARVWLPAAIIGVVIVYQLLIVPLGGPNWQFWSQLLFYGILGPLVTYVTLQWIAEEVRLREEAQEELARLYSELRSSHQVLERIQGVTEQFVSASDLETVLGTATKGITDVADAIGTLVVLNSSGGQLVNSYGLSPELQEHALENSRLFLAGKPLPEEVEVSGKRYWLLSSRLQFGRETAGSVHAYFSLPLTSKERDGFGIISSELSAAAEAVSTRTRDLVTLFEVDKSIRAEENLDRLLSSLLDHIMNRVEARSGGVYLADDEGMLHLRSAQGIRSGETRRVQRPGQGLAGSVAVSREARILSRVPPEMQNSSLVVQGGGSAVALPLLGEGGLLGVVVLAHPEEEHFDSESLPFLGLLASQVSLAVHNARAYLHSEEVAIVEERARIAREIHDGVAQALAFSALKLDLVERLLQRDPDKAAVEVVTARNTIRETIKEVRRSIFALRPVELERHGFIETLRRYLVDYGQQNEIQVELEVQQQPALSAKGEAVLFRIFQEAMNNVAKHSKATRVRVCVGRNDAGQAFIRVEDNGCGFDVAAVSDRVTSAGGLGLRQMRERVDARGGIFRVSSAPGGGTVVFAAIAE